LNRNQELPRDRAELYTQSSRVLLQQWEVEKALDEADALAIDYKDKQAMLRAVAFHMQATTSGLAGNLIRGQELQAILSDYLGELKLHNADNAATQVIDQLRQRNFILCYLGADYYAIVHRTFLEYFCAWEFVWRFEKEQTLSLDSLLHDVFEAHYQDESWHEVLRLICGMIDSKFVGEIVEFLMGLPVDRTKVNDFGSVTKESYIHLLLAVDCIGEARNPNLIVVPRSKLLGLLKHTLQTLFVSLFSDVPAALVRVIAQGWADDSDTLLWLKSRARHDEYFTVRQAAVEAIAQGWADDYGTLPWLKSRVQHDSDEYVRQAAVQELARGWADDPETLTILKSRAQHDKNWQVRQAVVRELARGWADDPETLTWLKSRAQHDEDSTVRQAAVQELARGWADDPETLTILKSRAQHDKNWQVRQAVVRELAQGWVDDPETLTILKSQAQYDSDEYVRRVTVRELAQGWIHDPELFDFLWDRALHDPVEHEPKQWRHPRLAALEAILRNYPDHPRLKELLVDRANNDADQKVRELAQQQFKRRFGNEVGELI
ncbi:MAG: HEAT repeat domain-containing protein, partial [Cyanobacteria bacterium P01_H01_bin.121]